MDRLAVGRIGGAFGLSGAVKVKSLSGETDHFLGFREVFVRHDGHDGGFDTYRVERVDPYRDGVLLKLEGVDTPEDGDKLRGREIWVEREQGSALAEGEYYLADLCRCRVFQGGSEIGRVAAVCEGGNAELLEVEGPTGERFIVPFSDPFVGDVDVARGSIHLTAEFERP
jgi:16S rRNA processing protein RimM